MGNPLRLLIVEDQDDDAAFLLRHLRKFGFDVQGERVDNAVAMASALARQNWDAVVADYCMPSFSALAALALLRERGLDVPFLIVSGTVGEEIAAGVMRAGAHDYIMKNNLTRLVPAIERELREAEGRRVRRRAEERVAYLAYHEPLTGLANRNFLVERITATLATESRLALLLLELNRFRDIINTLGHRHGDHLLFEVGTRLRDAVDAMGTVAHFGGEKFAVLLPAADLNSAMQVGRKLRSVLDHPVELDGFRLDVDASIGLALAPEHGMDPGALIRRADVAQLTARERDGGVALYESSEDLFSPRRLALIGQLREALSANQLFLVYQPKIDLRTLQTVGVEALLRWRHPQLGLIPPDEFIPLAERAGLIGIMTLSVLDTALHCLQKWQAAGFDISMAVNLSARNVQDSHLAAQVEKLLFACGIRPERLEMEITESHIMEDPARAKLNLLRLKSMGVHLSIDDFGTGYSSLDYLRTLPVGTLKIDKSFVSNGLENAGDATIVRSTIELGHNLGLRVIAEGVEDQQTLDRLLALDCDEAQGFLFAQPMPDAELLQWLSESRWRCYASEPASARN
jgi:diguanylate cyclase (GGDEF)-like protein